mmetsp:Transcript_4887/g.10148  ORF Transcript_4887/g.10148 Transcript_4887/m.10148 type:complete len:116 (+) Transcript_4887:1749-2096(+)
MAAPRMMEWSSCVDGINRRVDVGLPIMLTSFAVDTFDDVLLVLCCLVGKSNVSPGSDEAPVESRNLQFSLVCEVFRGVAGTQTACALLCLCVCVCVCMRVCVFLCVTFLQFCLMR